MQTVKANGAEIPALGFGVFRMSDEEVERVVPAALEAGFRHFDTAQIYRNEAALGRALQAAGGRRAARRAVPDHEGLGRQIQPRPVRRVGG